MVGRMEEKYKFIVCEHVSMNTLEVKECGLYIYIYIYIYIVTSIC